MKDNDYKAWMQYARKDLSVAMREMERIVSPRLRPYEIILYLCHQTSEKALKSYLIYNGERVFKGSKAWGHDLGNLRLGCLTFDASFDGTRIVNHCAFLDAFATIRYPDFKLSVTAEDVNRGINSARRIYNFVANKVGLEKFELI